MAAVTLVDTAHISMSDQSSRSLQFSILSLRDPGNDNDDSSSSMREYMLVSSTSQQHQPYDIYEIQTVLPHAGKYAAFFVASRVVSNPALHITTRVDPLFFALAHLQRVMAAKESGDAGKLEKWQPIDQALGDISSCILSALNLPTNLAFNGVNQVGQLGHLLDVSDMCGDDLILCKFSEDRTLKWLVAKFERSTEALRRRLSEAKKRASENAKDVQIQGGSGAFSSSFTVAEKEEPNAAASSSSSSLHEKDSKGETIEITGSALSKNEEQSIKVGALQLICDYIPTEWKDKLSKEVGLAEGDWIGKKKLKSPETSNGAGETVITGEKRSRSSWEGNIGQADADALLQYTTGNGADSKMITPGEKREVRNAKSVGLKRLAKVNTKGMKSMTSFFGASKKKK